MEASVRRALKPLVFRQDITETSLVLLVPRRSMDTAKDNAPTVKKGTRATLPIAWQRRVPGGAVPSAISVTNHGYSVRNAGVPAFLRGRNLHCTDVSGPSLGGCNLLPLLQSREENP